MLAFLFPGIPPPLAVAFDAAGVLALGVASARSTSRWERVFAGAFAAFVARFAYATAVFGSSMTLRIHSIVFLLLLSIALVGFTLALRVAETHRQRFASAAMALFILPSWWQAVRGAFCGSGFPGACHGFGSRQIPAPLMFMMFLSAFLLLASVTRADDAAPLPRIVRGLAFYSFFFAYASLFPAIKHVPPSRMSSLIQLTCQGGALVCFAIAALRTTDARRRLIAIGLASYSVPLAWFAVQVSMR